jgi:hypothetical protein
MGMDILEFDLGDAHMQAFIDLPWQIYGADVKWVPPLKSTLQFELSSQSPFFLHADARFFLVRRDGRFVARVLATVDKSLLASDAGTIGHLGYFDCIDDVQVAEALMNAAEAWMRKQSVVLIQGPVNCNIMLNYRLQLTGFDTEPFLGEPRNPAYYEKLWVQCGYEAKNKWLSFDLSPANMAAMRDAAMTMEPAESEYRVEAVDLANLDRELAAFYPAAGECYRENFGATSITAAELDVFFRPLASLFQPGDFGKAVDKKGNLVGYIFGYWDLSEAFRAVNGDPQKAHLLQTIKPKRYLLHSFGVVPALQKSSVIYQLMNFIAPRAVNTGMPIVGCLAKDGRTVYDKVAKANRSYAIFSKKL